MSMHTTIKQNMEAVLFQFTIITQVQFRVEDQKKEFRQFTYQITLLNKFILLS